MALNGFTIMSGISTLIIGLLLTVIFVCGYTWASTSIFFRQDIKSNQSAAKKDASAVPPLIPYAIPGLGSTITFSNQKIGGFFEYMRLLSRKYGGLSAFSILLNGTRTHFIFSPQGVASVLKARQLTRVELDQQLGTNVLAMSKEDAIRAFPEEDEHKEKTTTARIHSEHLLGSAAVNGLTSKFMECLNTELAADDALDDGVETELYAWLWQKVFRASTTALCGSKLLQMYPDFDKDYRTWEDNMLGMLFGIPRIFARPAYAARDATVDKLQKWLEEGYKHSTTGGDPEWEPYFGARVMHKRHEFYKQQDLSIRGQAGFDLIFLAGILSNATPATGWMLLHLLSPTSPPDLKQRIMKEIHSVQRSDGSIDVPALAKLPLLNSVFHETLRLYVDLLVVRKVNVDVALDNKHYVRKGEMVMAPSWMTHRSPEYFDRPTEFDAERFLAEDPETGELTYSVTGLNGKFWPFSGGSYMCPGRTFAKQEVLGTVAVLLLNFDIQFIEFMRRKKNNVESLGSDKAGFPTPKDNYAGNQVVGIEGDMKIRIKRRSIHRR